jgi:hypothetical protein
MAKFRNKVEEWLEEWLKEGGYTLRDWTESPDDDLDSKRSDDDYKSKQSSYSSIVPDGVTNVSTHGEQDTRQSAATGTGISISLPAIRKIIQAIPVVYDKIKKIFKKDKPSVPDVAEAPIDLPDDGKPNIILDERGVRIPTKLPYVDVDVDDILDSASSHLLNNVGTDNISSNSRGSNLARLAILGFDALGNILTNDLYRKQQRELINQMNEYNTPAAQMQRYKDAGLNPNLMAGQISAGNQSSAGEPHAMQLHPIDALTAASNVNLQAAQADEIRERAIAQRNANSLFAYDSLLKALSINELQSRINKQIKDLEMMESQKKLNEAQTKSLNDLRQTEKELKKAQTKLAQIQEEYTPKNAASRLGKGFSDLWDITWSIMNLFWTGAGTNDKAPVPNPDVLSRKYIYKYD